MRKVILFIITIGIVAVGNVATAKATNNQFVQEIIPASCVLTFVTTEYGQRAVGECPTDIPVISSAGIDSNGKRTVYGFFDSSRTATLRAVFNGVTYIAGVTSSPLALNNDAWAFTIDDTPFNVPAGDYFVTAQAVLFDGRIMTTGATLTLPAVEVPDTGPGDGPAAEPPVSTDMVRQPGYSIVGAPRSGLPGSSQLPGFQAPAGAQKPVPAAVAYTAHSTSTQSWLLTTPYGWAVIGGATVLIGMIIKAGVAFVIRFFKN